MQERGRFCSVRRGKPVLHDVGRTGVVFPIIIAGNGRAAAVMRQSASDHSVPQLLPLSLEMVDRADDDCVTRDITNDEPADQNIVARAN